jgi:hypothetical protein
MRRGSQKMQLSVSWTRAHEERIIEDAAKDKVSPGPIRRESQRILIRKS